MPFIIILHYLFSYVFLTFYFYCDIITNVPHLHPPFAYLHPTLLLPLDLATFFFCVHGLLIYALWLISSLLSSHLPNHLHSDICQSVSCVHVSTSILLFSLFCSFDSIFISRISSLLPPTQECQKYRKWLFIYFWKDILLMGFEGLGIEHCIQVHEGADLMYLE